MSLLGLKSYSTIVRIDYTEVMHDCQTESLRYSVHQILSDNEELLVFFDGMTTKLIAHTR